MMSSRGVGAEVVGAPAPARPLRSTGAAGPGLDACSVTTCRRFGIADEEVEQAARVAGLAQDSSCGVGARLVSRVAGVESHRLRAGRHVIPATGFSRREVVKPVDGTTKLVLQADADVVESGGEAKIESSGQERSTSSANSPRRA